MRSSFKSKHLFEEKLPAAGYVSQRSRDGPAHVAQALIERMRLGEARIGPQHHAGGTTVAGKTTLLYVPKGRVGMGFGGLAQLTEGIRLESLAVNLGASTSSACPIVLNIK